MLFCFFKPRALAAIGTAILVGYWALLTFVPIRDVHLERTAVSAKLGVAKPTLEQAQQLYASTTARVSGVYDPGRNLANHLDFEFLGGRKYDGYYDPEGLLSTGPAVVSCLLGVFAGLLLRRRDWGEIKKVTWLAVAGAAREHPDILIAGLVLSVALMGIAANIIAQYIERYRWIAYVGLVVIVYVAFKMIWEGFHEVQPHVLAFAGM